MKIVVPETADLRRVFEVLAAVAEQRSPHETCGLSQRQASYALQAALAMHLLERSGAGYSLTSEGRRLQSCRWGSAEAHRQLREAVESMALFRAIPDLLAPTLDASELADRLHNTPSIALAKTTARKRATALVQWRQLFHSTLPESEDKHDRLLLLQLSDLHLSAEATANPILARLEDIVAVVGNRFELWPLSCCVIAVTGDVADRGGKAEYAIARDFLKRLGSALEGVLRCKTYFVLVPGNHDCNHSGSTSVRDKLLEQLSLEQVDNEIYNAIQCVQSEFDEFAASMESDAFTLVHKSPATAVLTLRLGGKTIRFDKYNTAWCSQINEQQGRLIFPVPTFSDVPDADAVVAMLHHPLSWIENVSARAFRQHLVSTADIVLTGHEHVATRYSTLHETGEQTEFSEGSVLQEAGDPDQSGFVAMLLDFGKATQTSYKFSLVDSRYDAHPLPSRNFKRAAIKLRNTLTHTDSIAERLRDPGDAYSHPRKKQLELGDIYVEPELKPSFISGDSERLEPASIELVLREEQLLICGQELSGKTTLAKALCAKLYEEGITPILIRGDQIKSSEPGDLDALRNAALVEQYGPSSVGIYQQLPRERRALLVDDAHKSRLRRNALNTALATLERAFGYTVVFADEEFPVSLLEAKCDDDSGILAYETFVLQPFGRKRRYRLVEKWCYLGRSASEEDAVLSSQAQRLDELLDRAMGSSLLPALPCLILLCLQQIDSSQRSELSDGSFGHLYDALVTANLSLRGQAKIDVGSKRTVLSRFAYHLYTNELQCVSDAGWRAFYADYLSEYDASFSEVLFLEELLQSNLLRRSSDGSISFRYKYSYCLFAALYLVRLGSEGQVAVRARELCECLHNDDDANILLFLAHFAADGPVADTLVAYARELLPTVAAFDLHASLRPLGNSPHIHRLSLDAATPEERRDLDRDRRDQAERSSPSNAEVERLPEQLSQYVRALRAVHILGQVLKSSSGTMKAERKAQLLSECYQLATRTVAAIVSSVVAEHGPLSEDLARLITLHRPELVGDLAAVRQHLMRFLISLCEGLVYNTAVYVSNSVGAASLGRTYDRVRKEDDDLLTQMFDLAIRLDHLSAFPKSELETVAKTAQNKHSPTNVLRLLVWRHLYLFPVDFRLRRQLCQRFDIKERYLLERRVVADG